MAHIHEIVSTPLNCPGMYRGLVREDGALKTAIFDDEELRDRILMIRYRLRDVSLRFLASDCPTRRVESGAPHPSFQDTVF